MIMNTKNINEMTEQEQYNRVSENPKHFEQILNPSNRVSNLAVKLDGFNIQFIENPTYVQKVLAITNRCDSLQFIENPDLNLKVIAMQMAEDHCIGVCVLDYFELDSYRLRKMALETFPEALEYIENPTEREVKISTSTFAVKKISDSFASIN